MGWASIRDSFTKGVKDVGKFAWKGTKQVTAFQLNMVTLGAANKFTSVSKWGGTGFAGKAGTAVGIGGAAIVGGAYAAGLFAPAATSIGATGAGATIASGAGTTALETSPMLVGGEVGGGMFAEEAAAGSGVFWAEPAAASVSAGGGAIATGAGTTASFLPSTSSLLGAGLLASLFKGVGAVAGAGAEKYMNEVFGGSSGAPGSSGSGGFAGGGDMGGGGILGGSKLPFIIIGIVLLGAYLLIRKGRK
jgi:hypothetical protein